MASALSRLKGLVDSLGTPRDTQDLRRRLADHNAAVQGLARGVKARVTRLSALEERQQQQRRQQQQEGGGLLPPPPGLAPPPQREGRARRLVLDFAALLNDYKSVQRLAADKEAACLPRGGGGGPASPASAAAAADDVEAQRRGQAAQQQQQHGQQMQQMQQQQQQQRARLGAELALNEALIEERDAGVVAIQRQIGEVNEMFQDLAVLVSDQGGQLLTVDAQVAATAERVGAAARQLQRAEGAQRKARNRWLGCWLVAAAFAALLIVILFS
jgi:syntaxin 7